jgi:phosphate transport system substrate-binding protein
MNQARFGLAILFLAATACSVCAQAQVRGAGSTFAAAAYTSWGFSYSKEKHVAISYQATGSGDGIRQIVAHSVDFGASDYAMSPEELNKHGLIQFPTLVGGIVPVVNIPGIGPGQLKLTGPVLAGIFSGQISHWNDPEIKALNPALNLPSSSIKPVVRSDDSGSTACFTEYLSKVDANWAKRIGSGLHVNWPRSPQSGKGNEGVASMVLSNAGAIGYVSSNQVFRSKLSYALLQNRSKHFVAPTDDALVAAVKSSVVSGQPEYGLSFVDMPGPNSWPITDATYVLIDRNPRNPALVRDVLRFFYWAFLRGDSMATETGYVPLPSSVQARVVNGFRQVRDADGNSLDFMSSEWRRLLPLVALANY